MKCGRACSSCGSRRWTTRFARRWSRKTVPDSPGLTGLTTRAPVIQVAETRPRLCETLGEEPDTGPVFVGPYRHYRDRCVRNGGTVATWCQHSGLTERDSRYGPNPVVAQILPWPKSCSMRATLSLQLGGIVMHQKG